MTQLLSPEYQSSDPKVMEKALLTPKIRFFSAAPDGSKRRPDMERQKTRLPKKAKFSHPNSGLDNSKLPDSEPVRSEGMNNRTNIARADKLSPSPGQMNRTVNVRDTLCVALGSGS